MTDIPKVLVFCAILIVSLYSPVGLADEYQSTQADTEIPAKSLFGIIKKFGNEIYRIADDNGGDETLWNAAEAKALTEIESALSASENTLFEVDDKGRTPLILASYLGYGFIVEAISKDGAIAGILEVQDRSGLTAYGYSLIALNQTLKTCHPNIKNSIVLASFEATQPYYSSRTPYPDISKILKQAGADSSQDTARAMLLKRCSNKEQKFQNDIETTDDIQQYLLNYAAE